tara:strand:- start:3555 stop:6809 length:3255 start_codon:yes stop_codon:yes gene_type:complete
MVDAVKNWLQGDVPAGSVEPADKEFTSKTQGGIPISEAERLIRKNQERMSVVTGPIGKIFRSLSQVYVNPLLPEKFEIDTNEEAEQKRIAQTQKAVVWRNKRDAVKNELVDIFHKANDAYAKSGNEEILQLALQTKDEILQASNLTDFDMNPQISSEAYILRDDSGLWKSAPNPYPQIEYLSEAVGGLFGMNKGYAFGEALLTKKFIRNMSKGAAAGFARAQGPWWAKVAGSVIGGAAAVGAADFGYELMLDLMNQAGKAKENLKDDPTSLKKMVYDVVPDALTFGPRGINRPGMDERWESVKKDAILDASISSVFFGARPLYYGLKRGIGTGVFGMGKKGPGAGAIDPKELIEEEAKLLQKFGGDELLKTVQQKENLNIPVVGGVLTDLLRSRFGNILGPQITGSGFVQGTGLGKHHISAAGFVGGVEPMLGRIPWIGKFIKDHLGQRGELYGRLSDNMLGRLNPYASMGEMDEAYKILGQKRFKWFQTESKELEKKVLEAGDSYGDIMNDQAVRVMARSILNSMKSTWAKSPTGRIKPNAANAKWIKLLEQLSSDSSGKSVRQMFNMRKELDFFVGKGGLGSVARDPESLKDLTKLMNYAEKGSKDDVVDLIKAWDTDIGRLGSEYDAPQVVRALTDYDRFVSNGLLMYGTDAGAVAGKIGKFGYELALKNDPTRAAQSLFRTAIKSGDPSSILKLKNIVGDEAYYRGVGMHVKDIFDKNIKEVDGIMKPNYGAIRDALGISRKAKAIEIKPFWDKALESSTSPITKIDGKEFDEVLFKSGFPEGTMKSTELRKLPQLDDFRQLLDVMEKVFKNGIPSMSVFMARRATIGGVRAGLNAALPTQVLGGGTQTFAGTSGALSLIGGQWFWPLMGAWTLRYGGKVITSPVNMRAYRNAIDTNLPESVRALNLTRLMRNMPEEWESFDQDLAEMEEANKQLIKSGANKDMVDAWGNRAAGMGERLINSAYDIGEKILGGETPYVPKAFEPANLPFSYMKGEQSEPVAQYADQVGLAAGDDIGDTGVTGSVINQNTNFSPNTAGALYQGNLDSALASQYGGQADGGMIEPLNAPRSMDKRGIISLVS